MRSEIRNEILRQIEAICRLCPSYRLCQMVTNVAALAQADGAHDLAEVTDEQFQEAEAEVIQARIENVGYEPADAHQLADPNDSWTLPPLLSRISRGLEELGKRYPDKSFVSLVMRVAEWTKEFAPYEFWDVEDADFLRAMQAHLAASPVTR